jgi:hypothetical protein
MAPGQTIIAPANREAGQRRRARFRRAKGGFGQLALRMVCRREISMGRMIGLLAAGSLLAAAAATPADAREWRGHYHYHDGGGFSDFVAGAFLIGGIAAIASAIGHNSRARQDAAVDHCAREAEDRTGARVMDIVHVDSSKGYYTVEGTLDGPPPGDRGPPPSFRCVIHDGAIYSFHATPEHA